MVATRLKSMARTTLLALGWERRRRVAGREYRFGGRLLASPMAPPDYEPWMDAVYAAALALGPGAAIDVGVNRMQTLMKILALDPERRYVGFEPQLPAALAAKDFAERNGLGHVEIVAAALSEAPGTAVLQLTSSRGFDGAASISTHRPDGFYRRRSTVPVLRGDDALDGMGLAEVALLNVDVEGAELEVLRGLRRTLAQRRPVVAFEVLNDWIDPAGDPEAEALSRLRSEAAAALETLLREAGMRIYGARPDGLIGLDRIERATSDDLALCSYAAVPEEAADAFRCHAEAFAAGNPLR